MKYIGLTKSPIKSGLKKLFWLFTIVVSITALVFLGNYLYKKKTQRDLQNQIRDSQREMVDAVRNGSVVIDYETHLWVVKPKNERPFSPLKIELFVHNKWTKSINGNLVFKAEFNSKALEEPWLNAAIDKILSDGFSINLLKSEEFAKSGDKERAIASYIKRGKKLLPGKEIEPLENSKEIENYSFSFRKLFILNAGEVQRFIHTPDLPYDQQGNSLKVRVVDIEFN